MKKISYLVIAGLLCSALMTGCGTKQKEDNIGNFSIVGEDINGEMANGELPEEQLEGEKNEGAGADGKAGIESGSRIESQTFEVTLNPLGEVTFTSYEADFEKNPLADAVFQIERDGEVLQKLEGPFADDCRTNEVFSQVEAVSFPDYNRDGYDDIIVICSYTSSSGPDVGTAHSEIRYYTGSKEGTFYYEKQMSLDGTSALAEITIETAKGFLGMDIRVPETDSQALEPWQQAYIDYLQQDSDVEAQEGYVLIFIDEDEIPELVEIGRDMATGCRIVNYADGAVHVTQLNRLYFSYIKRGNLLCNSEGNMDCYYDLVYSIVDGKMTLIAEGYYGAEDNSNVQFDDEGEPIYQYEWNGKDMSKAEYEKSLNEVYDTSKAEDGYFWEEWYSVDEMIGIVSNDMR